MRWVYARLFLSTLSLRRATIGMPPFSALYTISIHALLAESDWQKQKYRRESKISIHALLAESDRQRFFSARNVYDFYPRSPCGERLAKTKIPQRVKNFYPRSPCGERLFDTKWPYTNFHISIHALLAESDTVPDLGKRDIRISIHALLAESDLGYKIMEVV